MKKNKKQMVIESILKREVTHKELSYIKEHWHEFYKNPELYANTVDNAINFALDEIKLIEYKRERADVFYQLTMRNVSFSDCETEIQVDNRFRSLLMA